MAEQFLIRAGPTALTASVVTQHTSTNTSGYLMLTTILLTNTTASTVAVRVHLVPSGGSANAANAIIYDTPVLANDVVQLDKLNIPMYFGDFIQALGLAVNITITMEKYLTPVGSKI